MLEWHTEHAARWDADKHRIICGAPEGVFDSRFAALAEGDSLPGEWWRVTDEGRVVGYGWLDAVWGDAEILLATDPEAEGHGVGTFIVDRLARAADERGLRYVYNVVRPTHPNAEEVTRWLEKRGFEMQADGRLLRRARPDTGRSRHGSVGWVDLTVEDAPALRDFYARVAGWTFQEVPMEGYADFAMLARNGDAVAGICHRRGANAGMPAGWMVYIAVDDLEGAIAECEAAGGEVLERPAEDRPMGIVKDPSGAVVALWRS